MNRYRFAPSPTGHLHIGGARTALYNYLLARQSQGHLILRIEDTDRERSTQEYVDAINEAMAWLGLDTDEGPFYQTERSELYRTHLEKLLAAGKAYRCFCTPDEIAAKREAAMKAGQKPKYDGTCRNLDPQSSAQDDRAHCIRFRSPDTGTTQFEDLIKGPIEFNNAELDDLVIARTDGTPTYNFVVVIDDLSMKITHVIRGDDHINNTPRQIQLYQAFDYPIPQFAHVPMILGSDKKRLSKRHGATSVLAYREAGFLPEALLNYLVRLGWSHGDEEIFSKAQMIELFSIEKVGKSAAVFDPEKLLWLNGHWIRKKNPQELLATSRPFLENLGFKIVDQNYAERAIKSCQEKVKTLVELAEMASFYFVEEVSIDEKAKQKGLQAEGLATLEQLQPLLAELPDDQPETYRQCLQEFGEAQGIKFGKIGQPLRAALAGSMSSPDLYDILSILGKARIQTRLGRVINNHGAS